MRVYTFRSMKKVLFAIMILASACSSDHSRAYTEAKLKESVINWVSKCGMKPGDMEIIQLTWKDSLDLYSFNITARIKYDNGGDTIKAFKNNLATNDFKLIDFDGASIDIWEYNFKNL